MLDSSPRVDSASRAHTQQLSSAHQHTAEEAAAATPVAERTPSPSTHSIPTTTSFSSSIMPISTASHVDEAASSADQPMAVHIVSPSSHSNDATHDAQLYNASPSPQPPRSLGVVDGQQGSIMEPSSSSSSAAASATLAARPPSPQQQFDRADFDSPTPDARSSHNPSPPNDTSSTLAPETTPPLPIHRLLSASSSATATSHRELQVHRPAPLQVTSPTPRAELTPADFMSPLHAAATPLAYPLSPQPNSSSLPPQPEKDAINAASKQVDVDPGSLEFLVRVKKIKRSVDEAKSRSPDLKQQHQQQHPEQSVDQKEKSDNNRYLDVKSASVSPVPPNSASSLTFTSSFPLSKSLTIANNSTSDLCVQVVCELTNYVTDSQPYFWLKYQSSVTITVSLTSLVYTDATPLIKAISHLKLRFKRVSERHMNEMAPSTFWTSTRQRPYSSKLIELTYMPVEVGTSGLSRVAGETKADLLLDLKRREEEWWRDRNEAARREADEREREEIFEKERREMERTEREQKEQIMSHSQKALLESELKLFLQAEKQMNEVRYLRKKELDLQRLSRSSSSPLFLAGHTRRSMSSSPSITDLPTPVATPRTTGTPIERLKALGANVRKSSHGPLWGLRALEDKKNERHELGNHDEEYDEKPSHYNDDVSPSRLPVPLQQLKTNPYLAAASLSPTSPLKNAKFFASNPPLAARDVDSPIRSSSISPAPPRVPSPQTNSPIRNTSNNNLNGTQKALPQVAPPFKKEKEERTLIPRHIPDISIDWFHSAFEQKVHNYSLPFFYHLLTLSNFTTASSPRSSFDGLLLPDTIVFVNTYPVSYYYSGSNGLVREKPWASLSPKKAMSRFEVELIYQYVEAEKRKKIELMNQDKRKVVPKQQIAPLPSNSVVCRVCSTNSQSSTPEQELYFPYSAVETSLFTKSDSPFNRKSTTSLFVPYSSYILQQFIPPISDYHELFELSWSLSSPSSMDSFSNFTLKRRIQKYVYLDTTLTDTQRFASFDQPVNRTITNESEITEGRTFEKLQRISQQIAVHLSKLAANKRLRPVSFRLICQRSINNAWYLLSASHLVLGPAPSTLKTSIPSMPHIANNDNNKQLEQHNHTQQRTSPLQAPISSTASSVPNIPLITTQDVTTHSDHSEMRDGKCMKCTRSLSSTPSIHYVTLHTVLTRWISNTVYKSANDLYSVALQLFPAQSKDSQFIHVQKVPLCEACYEQINAFGQTKQTNTQASALRK